MIRYEWFRKLGGDDLRDTLELVRVAAEYDEEAGFSQIGPDLVRAGPSYDDVRHHHLLVHGQLDEIPRPDSSPNLVAYLHLTVDGKDDSGVAHLVVHPDFRSLGVATMLVEELGLDVDAPGGWCGTGARSLRGWALGHHPAAERLTRRFGIGAATRTWQMIRHLTGPFAQELPEVPASIVPGAELDERAAIEDVCRGSGMTEEARRQLILRMQEGGGQRLFAAGSDGRPVAFLWYDPEIRRVEGFRSGAIRAMRMTEDQHPRVGLALMVRALELLREAGAQIAAAQVDPDEPHIVRITRLLAFERTQDDVLYAVGAPLRTG